MQQDSALNVLTNLDAEIAFHERQQLESKVCLARLRSAKISSLKNYEFLRTQKEAEELIKILTSFPQLKSAREIQVVFCISRMMSAKEIADYLCISDKTVKFHKTNIYRKLSVKTEKDLVAKYFSTKSNGELPVTKCL